MPDTYCLPGARILMKGNLQSYSLMITARYLHLGQSQSILVANSLIVVPRKAFKIRELRDVRGAGMGGGTLKLDEGDIYV
jgi:hypothetical protein